MTASSFVTESDEARPAVSVIIPALNSAGTIKRCMRALADQKTAHAYEVILVHSGEDDTCDIARATLPGARTIQLPIRALAAKARNVGVAAARAEVLAFIDSDAYADPAWIDNAVNAVGTDYDLVCGSIDNANPHSAVSRAEQLLMFSEFSPGTPQRPIWFALSGNVVMRRSAYERFGPCVEVRAAEDVIFSRRVIAAGGRILFYPRMRVFHDNRQTVRGYVRNQLLLGRYTALARRVVAFSDVSYPVFLVLVPFAPFAKLAKILWRVCRWNPKSIAAVIREFPLFALGLLAYGAGQVRGSISRSSAATGSTTAAELPELDRYDVKVQ